MTEYSSNITDTRDLNGQRGSSLVSVIIPTYNRAELVGRAIQSVLDQTYQDFEIIVVDDASIDNTENIVKGIIDERIRYIRHERNKGAAITRNTGIKAAQGKYIAFQDSDDEWLPDKLEKQVSVFEKAGSKIDFVYCDMLMVEPDGRKRYHHSPDLRVGRVIDENRLDYQALGIGTPTVLVRRECFDKVGGFDELFPRLQDADCFIRLAKHFVSYHLTESLVLYNKSEVSISSDCRAYSTAITLLLEKYFDDVKHNKKFLARQYRRIGSVLISCGDSREGRRYLIKGAKACPLNVKALLLALISFFGKGIYVKLLKLQSGIKRYMKYLRGR